MSVPAVPRPAADVRGLRRLRRPLAIGGLLLVTGGLSACGSGDDDGAGAAGGPGGGRQPIALTDEQQSCLEKAGVTIPTGGDRPGRGPRGGGDPGAGGPPPEGTDGAPPAGERPGAGQGAGGERVERQAAMEACGVSLPGRPPGARNGTTGTPGPAAQSAADGAN